MPLHRRSPPTLLLLQPYSIASLVGTASRSHAEPHRRGHDGNFCSQRRITHLFTVLLFIFIFNRCSIASAASQYLSPWVLMMQDTENVALKLRHFPDHFSASDAALDSSAAAAAAIGLSTSLLSLRSRYSNLCTAAYGGYNGALSLINAAVQHNVTRLKQERFSTAAVLPCVCRF
jgi:hypothetical protein